MSHAAKHERAACASACKCATGPAQQRVAQAARKAAEAEGERRKRAAPFEWSEVTCEKVKQQAERPSFPSMKRSTPAAREAAERQHVASLMSATHAEAAAVEAMASARSELSSFKRVALQQLSESDAQDALQGDALRAEVTAARHEQKLRAWISEDIQRLDDLINTALDHASADKQRGRTHTGVKAFKAFCSDVLQVTPHRPLDPLHTSLAEKLEEEWLCMRFVCALVEHRGITPSSAAVYFSAVQGWHAREHGIKLCAGLKLERLPQMLKGLRRIVGEAPRAVRRGISPQMLKRAMDLRLDPKRPDHANMRAALVTALQGLLRSKEFCGFDKPELVLQRSDIKDLSEERAILMMHPCKNMKHIGGKTCPLVIGGGGTFVDATWELRNLRSVDPVAAEREGTTPLFRDPLTNEPLTYAAVLNAVKELMAAIGEDASHFGTHSMRIGGATALFAAGANETVIRTMGRWSSDLHRLYVRACFEQCVDWTRKAGSTIVSDLAGEFDEVDDY